MAKTKVTRGGAAGTPATAKKAAKKGVAPAKAAAKAPAKKASGKSTRRAHDEAVAAVRAALAGDGLWVG